MADNFFEDLKIHLSNKLWQQIDIFNQAAKKLSELNYPQANAWAQAVTDAAQKTKTIEYKGLNNYQQIEELQALRKRFENQTSEYAQQIIQKIDTDIAALLSNGFLNYLVDIYGYLKTSFQQLIAFPLSQNMSLLSDTSSSLFVYIKLIELQLTNLSGMLPKLIHAQTMIPAISFAKEEEKEHVSIWQKTKQAISNTVFNNLIYYLNTTIFDKFEQSTFNTKNFTRLFQLLHHNLPLQNLGNHEQSILPTNTLYNRFVFTAQQLEERFSISKLLNGAWSAIVQKDEQRSDLFSPKQLTNALSTHDKKDLDCFIDPVKMKLVLTNKIASFCADLQNLLTLLGDKSGTNFFNTLKMWHSEDKNIPLCDFTLKALYDQL